MQLLVSASLAVYVCGYLSILLIILLAPDTLVWDEPWYVGLVGTVQDHGFSLKFLDSYAGPTFPLHTVVHYLAAPVTQLEAPGVRVLSFIFAGGVLGSLWITAERLGFRHPHALALTAVGIPLFWTVAGLAITQAPAMLFFSASVGLLVVLATPGQVPEERVRTRLVALSGLLLSVASFGRQSYLSVVPAILVLYLARSISLKQLCYFAAGALVLPLPLLVYWGGLVPPALPDWAQAVFAKRVVLEHGVLACAYAGVIVLIISPGWAFSGLTTSRRVISTVLVALIVFVINAELNLIRHLPMKPFMESVLSDEAVSLLTFGFSNLLAVLAALFVFRLAMLTIDHRRDPAYTFLSVSLFLMLGHTVVITHNFSSSYVAMSIPLFALIAMWHKTWSRLEFAASVCGVLIGASALTFNLGLVN